MDTASRLPTVSVHFGENEDDSLYFTTLPRDDFSVFPLALGVIPAADLALYLMECPGARRMDVLWDTLKDAVWGQLILVDGSRPDTFREALAIRKVIHPQGQDRVITVLTNPHHPEAWTATDLRPALHLKDDDILLSCDVRDRASVDAVLLALSVITASNPAANLADIEQVKRVLRVPGQGVDGPG